MPGMYWSQANAPDGQIKTIFAEIQKEVEVLRVHS